MTEKPGRKALFMGAMVPKKPGVEGGEAAGAAQVEELTAAVGAALRSALTGTEERIDPHRFRSGFLPLIETVNATAGKMASISSAAMRAAGSAGSAGAPESGFDARAMLEENPLPMLLLDTDGNIIEPNRAFLSLSGYTTAQIAGKSFQSFTLVRKEGDSFTEAIRSRKRAAAEVEIQFPTGACILESYAIPLFRADGTVHGILILYVDLTEKRMKERELAANLAKIEQLKHRAETIVQQNPMPIIVANTEFAIKVVNEAYVTLTGISRERLLGMSLREFKILSQGGEGLRTVISQKRRSAGEVTVAFPTGNRILEQYGIPILNAAGELREILIVYNDITEERKELEEIASLKRRSDVIVQQNPFSIILADTGFRVIETNEAFLKMSGFIRERFIGMNLKDIKILEKKGEGVRDAVQKKARVTGEVRVDLPSGIHILEQYAIPLLDTAGGITSILIVYNEVSAQRAQQEEIKKKMEEIAGLKKRSDVIVQENPMPIMVMDLQFNITLANEAYCRLSGIPKEKLLTMNAKSFRILNQKGEGLKQVVQQKKRSFGEVTVEFPGATKVLEQYGLPLLDDRGDLTHILTVYNDVTTVREQEVKIKEMIEEANAAKEILTASAGELEAAMTLIAQGNLTHKVSIDDADPLVKLKTDYNTAIDSIRAAMEELDRSMLQLEKTITEMNRSTSEILKATEQVAIASQKSSDNTSANLSAIEKLSAEVGEISASIEEIASTSQDVMQHAEKASKEGHVAAELGRVATSKMQMVEKISEESVNDITKLNEQMREINKIVKLIADIANQTNLLALNAAIEAARAGEHGRGFAVVAGEVKSLAGESKNASNQIENLIKTIQKKSETTASSMKNSFDEIKTGIDTVNQTIDSLNRIVTESEVVTQGITQITKATMDQADAANRVMTQTEESKKFTKENLERLQDMAAMAEETNASTEEIARASGALTDMANRLKNMMEQFRLQ
jgi:methyl-accepting chemotaxis protein